MRSGKVGDNKRKTRALKSRAPILEEVPAPRRKRRLETDYREANSELDEAWNVVISDGLSNEEW